MPLNVRVFVWAFALAAPMGVWDAVGHRIRTSLKASDAEEDHPVVPHAVLAETASTEDGQLDEEGEGVKDYPRHPEYAEPWTNAENLVKQTERALAVIDRLKAGGEATDEEKRVAFETMVFISNQVRIEMPSIACQDLCAMCVPSEAALESSQKLAIKSIFVERAKGWTDAVKMPVVGVVDGTAGLVAGAVGGLFVGVGGGIALGAGGGVAAGAAFNYRTNTTMAGIPGFVLGTVAGLSVGVVSTAALLVLAELTMPLMGAVMGVGLTGATTACTRVGFEAAVDGAPEGDQSFPNKFMNSEYGLKTLRKAMGYDKDWFTEAPAESEEIVALDSERALKSLDYAAISHCEYLRDRDFDIRHVMECLKHSMLCGSQGAFLFPTNDAGSCAAMSNAKMLEDQTQQDQNDGLYQLWQEKMEAKRSRAKCVAKLCAYKGFKRAVLMTHPDRVDNDSSLSDEEKTERLDDFLLLNECKDRFKGADGGELTLNSADERRDVCAQR